MLDRSVLFIGPMGVGKTTVSLEVAKALGLNYIDIDQLRWEYFSAQPDYDEQIVRELFESSNEVDAFRYLKPFEARYTVDVLKKHTDCVFDFGAGYTVYEDMNLFNEVKSAFFPYENIVYLRYSDDANESIEVLRGRHSDIPDNLYYALNKGFIQSPCNSMLAKLTIDTKGRSIQEVVNLVLSKLRINCI